MDNTSPHTVCPGCIVYALLHQNTFLQRWHDIQGTRRPTPPLQQHHYILSPAPALGLDISCHLGGTPIPPTPSPTPPPRQVIGLTFHPHADNEIAAVFTRSTADTIALCCTPFLSTHASVTSPPTTVAHHIAPIRYPPPFTSRPLSPPAYQCEITSHPAR